MNANKNGENMDINKEFFSKDKEHRRNYGFECDNKQNQINILLHDLDLLAIDYLANKYDKPRNSVLNDFIEAAIEDIVLFDDDLVSENDARYLLVSKVDEMNKNNGNSESWDSDLFFIHGSRENYHREFLPPKKEQWSDGEIYLEKITSNQYDILEKKLKSINKK